MFTSSTTRRSSVYVDARINNSTRARLLLDSGADRTAIAPRVLGRRVKGMTVAASFITAAGVAPHRSATLRGLTGEATVDIYEITSLKVGEARVGRLTVFGHDTGEPGSDGLLGRDFLEHFKVTIDNAAGRVTLAAK